MLPVAPLRNFASALQCFRRGYSSPPGRTSPLAFPTYTVWGANTGVGKTLASAGLAAALARAQIPLAYLKPVQTGFPTDSDALLVASACGSMHALRTGPHAAKLESSNNNSRSISNANNTNSNQQPQPGTPSEFKTLYAWAAPVSPHLAVSMEGRGVSDNAIASDLLLELNAFYERLPPSTKADAFAMVETAGGVASPMPSGTLQCDGLRPLRLPCILVGDPRLGGISATISAYESLLLRGYDVDVIVLMEGSSSHTNVQETGTILSLGNSQAIRDHFAKSVHSMGKSLQVFSLPSCPPPPPSWSPSRQGELDPNILDWLSSCVSHFDDLLQTLIRRHGERLQRLEQMGPTAFKSIWWPFTQHASLQEGSVQVVDSRWGEHWQVYSGGPVAPLEATTGGGESSGGQQMNHLYDACSSWWTQAANDSLHTEVARSVAYAAGRYLHVMFPENAHQPAIDAATRLLSTVGAGWAERVFFSDDGSTAIEVALKMAFRKFLHDRGGGLPPSENKMLAEDEGQEKHTLEVLGLQNAYHGDTLGAMDCVAPSVFNSKIMQAPWYTGRGVFLHPPYLALVRGEWQLVDPPDWLLSPAPSSSQRFTAQELAAATASARWGTQSEALSTSNRMDTDRQLISVYKAHIEVTIEQHEKRSGSLIGAAIIEPLLQGAGGMLLVDPLFQKILVQVCRSKGIPVIFDEVMTGLYRLGALSAGTQLLGEAPDIAAFAKLMTAGAVPGAATITTGAVFDAFKGSSKLHALLHGHSYTAYPIGCATTVAAIDMLTSPKTNPNLCHPGSGAVQGGSSASHLAVQAAAGAEDGSCASSSRAPYCCQPGKQCQVACGRLVPLWDADLAAKVSMHPMVRRVVHIGTIFATEVVNLQGGSGKVGYGSGASAVRAARLLRARYNIFARPIGGVVYLMVPPTTDRGRCKSMMEAVVDVLDMLQRELHSGELEGSTGGLDTEGCIV